MRELLLTEKEKFHFYSNKKTTNNNQEKITDLLEKRVNNSFSLELCSNRNLNSTVLKNLSPVFCSATWLGDESKIDKIPALVLCQNLQNDGYNSLLHLAGRNLTKFQALEILNNAKLIGIKNILALQGDSSRITEKDDAKCDFPYAYNLVQFIKNYFGDYFCIGVAGYPEKHPDSENSRKDLRFLKEKVSAGADFIITQATFQAETFQEFCRKCENNLSINIPIVFGVFIISSKKMLIGMSKICKIHIPDSVMKIITENQHNEAAVRNYGTYQATEIIKTILLYNYHQSIHIFTLNNLEIVEEVANRVFPQNIFLLNVEKILNSNKIRVHKVLTENAEAEEKRQIIYID